MKTESVVVRMYPDGRLSAKDAARYIGLADKMLAMMRVAGTGPRFVKRGRIFYFKDDLDGWIREGLSLTTAQAAK